MRWRMGGALFLAGLLAGCVDNPEFSANSSFAMATPAPLAATQPQADPSFRMSELKVGLSKAQLIELFPNRLVLASSKGGKQRYFIEPPGVSAGDEVARDRLELLVSDGKLAAFGVVHSDDMVVGATEVAYLPLTPKTASPPEKFGVQIATRQSEAEARAVIDAMRAKFPAQLGREWATINRVALRSGVIYRVVVGPLASAQRAAQLCDSLKRQGQDCFVRRS